MWMVPPRAVAVQLGHLDHLVNDALTGHGRVAVDEDRHNGILVLVLAFNPGAGDAAHHRIHRLKVEGFGAT